MRQLLFKAGIFFSLLVITAATFYLFLSENHDSNKTRHQAAQASHTGQYTDNFEEQIRELSERLKDSEQRVSEWEDCWQAGAIPGYFRKKMENSGQTPWPDGWSHLEDSNRSPHNQRSKNSETVKRDSGHSSSSTHGKSGIQSPGKGKAQQKEKSHTDSNKTQETSGPRYASGLLGLYYQGKRFEELKLVMTDHDVDFNYDNESPDRLIVEDGFSIRWVGFVKTDYAGTYRFYTLSDDGVRLWVGGSLVVNNWGDHAPTQNSGKIYLKKGYHPLRLDFYENGGGAVIKLYWSSDMHSKEIIPSGNLFHDLDVEEKIRKEMR